MYTVEIYEPDGEWSSNLPTIEKVSYEELGKLIYKWLNECHSISVRWK